MWNLLMNPGNTEWYRAVIFSSMEDRFVVNHLDITKIVEILLEILLLILKRGGGSQ
jgi:hypothetical protein